MKIRSALCILLAAGALSSLAQQGPDQKAEETRILALENAWNRAEENKDARALDDLLADSLVYVDYDGTFMDKAQFMASVKQPSLHPEQIVNETMTAHIYGNSAIVTGVYREKGVNKGKPYLRRGRFTDTWVSLNGTWVCVASQSTLISH
jgi:ketosteroid isomerase-like protein